MILTQLRGKALARVRITVWADGRIDYQVKRISNLDRSKLVQAIRAIATKVEREDMTRIYGPTGETLTTEAKLGDIA